MKKNVIRILIALAIVWSVYSVATFVLPVPRTAGYWLGYGFSAIALLTQLPVVRAAFARGKNPASRLYGFPIARVSVIYLVVQLIVGLVLMLMGKFISAWVALLIEMVILGAAVLGLLFTDAVRDEILRQDAELTVNVQTMRALRSKADALRSLAHDGSASQMVDRLADEFKYSDPVSSPATRESEANLVCIVDEIERALLDDDVSAEGLCRRALEMLTERNRLCKLNKGTG